MPLKRVAEGRDEIAERNGTYSTRTTIERAKFGAFVDNFVSYDAAMF